MPKYRVMAPVFVNGTLYEPKPDGTPLIIDAAKGLEGPALKPVTGGAEPPVKTDAGNSGDAGANADGDTNQ